MLDWYWRADLEAVCVGHDGWNIYSTKHGCDLKKGGEAKHCGPKIKVISFQAGWLSKRIC